MAARSKGAAQESYAMKPSDLLKKGWTQGVLARDASGNAVYPFSSEAECFCIAGAARGCLSDDKIDEFRKACLNIIGSAPYWNALADWNDAPGRTQAEVVALAERVEKEMGL